MLAFAPSFLVMVFTAFTDLAPLNPGARGVLVWTPGEFGTWIVLAVAGAAWVNYSNMKAVRHALKLATEKEESRRAIAAIGVAASWDLDLDRLYQRISQDLRSIIEFDRFTITSAQPSGRMKVEFVRGGTDNEGVPVGGLLDQMPKEPDGLYSDSASRYGSRLTVAIPASNGTLTIRCFDSGAYTSAHLELLRQAVAQISPGIANAVLFRASEKQVQERTVLAEIGRSATSAQDSDEIVEAIDESLRLLIDYDHMGVILLESAESDSSTGEVIYWSNEGLGSWRTGDRVSLNGRTIDTEDVIRTNGDHLFTDPESETASNSTRTWLRAPLVSQEQLIGILTLSSDQPGGFSREESALLLNVSLQVAPAIQNANLAASLKREADERSAIAAIGLAANEQLMLDAIYNRVADELAKVLQFDRLAISYINQEENRRDVAFVRGVEIDGYRPGDVRTLLNAPPNSKDEPDPSAPLHPLAKEGGLKSRISAPLGTSPNVLGEIHLASKRENAYDEQVNDFLRRIAIQIVPAIRNARMIAAERELRETLDRQNRELFEANNARKQFLSTVSHELKTPLTIISGFVDLLSSPDMADDQAERLETLGIIRRNADRLGVLINDILDISRVDAGTFKINPEPFPVNDLIADLEASFQSLLRTKTQTLRVNMLEDEVWVNADRSRIGQVVTNLLSNASKYSPEETEITLGCEVDDDRLHISIRDQGIGMSEEEQKGLFKAFFRVDNEETRKVPGTGLGLVIAKSITELHGGEIRLESRSGEGTLIELWLPGLTTQQAAEENSPEQQEMMGSRLWPEGLPDEMDLGAD